MSARASIVGELRLGFVALTDAAPLLVAEALGFFRDEGVQVSLSREGSWATARDKLLAGVIDGAHMLAPVALAARVGVGGVRADLIAPLALNAHGAAIALSMGLARASAETGLAAAAARRRLAHEERLSFGVVFPFSIHAYLLRDWLAAQGVDPDRDVRLVTLPPNAMVAKMAAGAIDGCCVGAPWHAVIAAQGLGEVAARAAQLDPLGSDKVFAVGEAWAQRNAEALQAMLRALVRAGVWADAEENRAELVALLAAPHRVDASPAEIASAFAPVEPTDRMVFAAHGVSRPRVEHALKFLSQMRRWGQVGPTVDLEAVARAVYRPDLTPPPSAD